MTNHSLCAQYPTVRERVINLPNFDDPFLHYGYFVGVNNFDFKFLYEGGYYENGLRDIEVKSNTGFNVGLIGDMRINKFINLVESNMNQINTGQYVDFDISSNNVTCLW